MVIPDLVSVIVPCYNAADYIGDAVGSALGQTYTALEVIAVDDGSTDPSLHFLELMAEADSRLRVLSQANRGPAAARNTGLRCARGSFVCFLDADDVFLPEKLRTQLNVLRRLPATDLVYSDYFMGDAGLLHTGFVPTCMPDGDLLGSLARRNWFAPCCPLLRRSLVDRVGFFDESIFGSEDWDYWIRCALAGGFSYLPGPVAVYRNHPAQVHADPRRMSQSARQVIAKHFPPASRLHHLAAACLCWSDAKSCYRAGRYWSTFSSLLRSEYHSRKAGGLALSVRETNTVVLPPAAGGSAPSAHAWQPPSPLLYQ